MTVFGDSMLAARLEGAVVRESARFADAARALGHDAAVLRVAGGIALYLASGSPLNHAAGLGLHGAVSEADIAEMEHFFAVRGERGSIAVCPLADPSLLGVLGARGWIAEDFEHVLVRPYCSGDIFPGEDDSRVRVIEGAAERDAWARVAATGFSAPLDPLPEQVALAEVVASRPGGCLLGGFESRTLVATGEVTIDEGIAWLSADTTLPAYQRRGLQTALQARRLALGRDAGCELAVTEAHPGSGSQRNMERLGFRVAYTRVELIGPNIKAGL